MIPASVASHDYGARRAAMFGETNAGWTVLLTYTEPPGKPSERLMALYDNDHDGVLDAVESQRVAPILESSARAGLRFEPALDWSGATHRVRYHRREGISVAVLIEHVGDLSVGVVGKKAIPLEFIITDKSGNERRKRVLSAGENAKIVR